MSLTPDCLAQLKLRQAPFEALPNQDFLYTDPLLDSLVETAVRALTTPGAIVIVAGVSGAGRSIHLMRLLGGLGEQFEIIAFRGRANIPFAAVEATIRSHLAAHGADDPNQSLRELFAMRGRSGMTAVLAIDDAHLLGMELIDHLLELRAEMLEIDGASLQLVLVGAPELNRNRLRLPDPEDEHQVVRLNLRPFNLEQAGAYLRHRLRVAGIDNPDAFLSSGDIAVLQSSAKGIPAALNAQANAWLVRRCLSANGVRQSIVGKISSLIAPAAPAAAASVEEVPFTPSRLAAVDNAPAPELDLSPPSAPADWASPAPPLNPELSQFLVREEKRTETTDFDRVLNQIRKTQLPPLTPPPPASAAAATPKPPVAALLEMMNRPWFIPAIVGVVVLAIVVPVVLQLQEPAPPTAPSLLVAAPRPEPIPPALPVEPVPVVAPTVAAPAPQNAPPPSTLAALTPEPEPPPEVIATPEPTPPASPPALDFAADRAWLERQENNRFTVQLLAARNMSKVNEFMESNTVEGIHTIKTRSFYVILVGSYPNRRAAEAAIDALPNAVRVNGPWIRTIGSVVDSIR
ncbi:hypothetical protein CKO12_09205 [Chromatium okenii]|uniref:AAA family ATPase n=1 Tax=Chromatium okenii TaxID=61644 RepID=UPI0019041801|nr:AAA family ATPase [Chromatium okenii]MBK1642047.1 hypothetical protein [Chromatium okenii]